MDFLKRTEMLIGPDAIKKLKSARVAVFGAGGVGCAVIEALARAGIGAIDIIDNDTYSQTNLNRQLFATVDTIGQKKTDIAALRIASINPDCKVVKHDMFYLPENADELPLEAYDYIVDAIDTVSAKIELAVRAQKLGVPIISSMGTGNKLDATAFRIDDIYKTSVCPLARVLRIKLKERGVKRLKVVYSKEAPLTPKEKLTAQNTRRDIPASISFVPSVAGFIIAGEVIKDIIK